MKYYFTLLAIGLFFISNAQYTSIPDRNFEQWLIDLAYKAPPIEGRVETRLIKNIRTVSIAGRGVKDLSGIEDFESLENFSADGSRFTKIDLSQNINLQQLSCNNCDLKQLDLTTNKAITEVFVDNNQLALLKLPDSTRIDILHCKNNQLKKLDLKNAMDLSVLYCDTNSIEKINLRNTRRMRRFYATSNQLNEVKLPLVKGGVGLPNFDLKNNPTLFCIDVGDSISFSYYSNYKWSKDSVASYEVNCRTVPSTTFEAVDQLNQIKLFPNPTNQKVEIIGIANPSRVSVYSLIGEKLTMKECIPFSPCAVNINGKTGVYFIQMEDFDSNSVVIKKILKN